MELALDSHPSFAGRPGPVLIVIADGVGVAPPGPSNAVDQAHSPTLDRLCAGPRYTELAAHGTAVGLPSDDDMGNSEVGHNAIGAGRIFAQGAKLVNKALESGAMFETDVWQGAIERAKDATLHFIGLHSDGNVHSNTAHLYRMLEQAATEGVTRARIHVLLDGRDTPARSAIGYLEETEDVLARLNDEHGVDYRIASGGGRMKITMDRYGADWEMVERGYDCHTHGVGRPFPSAIEAVETMYGETEAGDQYLEAFVVVDGEGDDAEPVGTMADGDAVIMFNFRGDRAIEISQAYEDDDFTHFDRTTEGPRPDLFYAGMLQYDGDALVPKQFLVDPPSIDRTMGAYLCAEGVPSFAVSETQKFGHVTYFWNGNRTGYLDESLETYVEIPSDNVEFDKTPGMKAREITAKTIELLESGDFRFGRINFANGDMVGHTGVLDATTEAMEAVDECMERLVTVIERLGGILIYTADHGNADIMYRENDEGERDPVTSHTLSPVPFAIFDPGFDGEYQLDPPDDAGLSHIAATTLNLLGFEAPDDYQPSLLAFS